jgi:hypothetical protein
MKLSSSLRTCRRLLLLVAGCEISPFALVKVVCESVTQAPTAAGARSLQPTVVPPTRSSPRANAPSPPHTRFDQHTPDQDQPCLQAVGCTLCPARERKKQTASSYWCVSHVVSSRCEAAAIGRRLVPPLISLRNLLPAAPCPRAAAPSTRRPRSAELAQHGTDLPRRRSRSCQQLSRRHFRPSTIKLDFRQLASRAATGRPDASSVCERPTLSVPPPFCQASSSLPRCSCHSHCRLAPALRAVRLLPFFPGLCADGLVMSVIRASGPLSSRAFHARA